MRQVGGDFAGLPGSHSGEMALEKFSGASVGPDWRPQAWQINAGCRPG